MARSVPRVIVNLKTYAEARGAKAVALAKVARSLSEELGVGIAVCPTALDLRSCVETGAMVFSQHIDRVERPESTGWLSAEAVAEAGAVGTLVNHSEHRVDEATARFLVDAARKAGLVTVLCTKDSVESGLLAGLAPDAVAVEPPELIGGNVSVTTADPGVVRRSVASVRGTASKVLVLCGAGIKTSADVARAAELGAYGVLLASGVTRAADAVAVMRALATPLVVSQRRD